MSDSDRVYQIERMESTLEELKNGQKAQGQILRDMSKVLKSVDGTLERFSKISEKQIRQGADISVLKDDSKIFRRFIDQSRCVKHDERIDALSKSDDSQNKNTFAVITTFITVGVSILATAFVTWLFTKGLK